MIERLEIVRKREGLNKAEFERKLSKSSGYLNMLKRRNSYPSAEVIANFSRAFPCYSLEWLLTNEGQMLRKTHEFSKKNPQKTTRQYYSSEEKIDKISKNQSELFQTLLKIEKLLIHLLQKQS
ncbi:helix-turn-helix domain-containing protein [Zunongwangia pacifica]|uniref:Helix-turn-helix domain-containing protein n=1 Tax=Zunongwangia pacifica TaxID=2911062 RepID=A0A9X2CQX9_9FLAO|nr:helix-turn-helix domain-containing protein [Zunongwangia pacifica]MCL6220502.1 helix-turn-helix domain-containing protein [Zunongwangia pacifica]